MRCLHSGVVVFDLRRRGMVFIQGSKDPHARGSLHAANGAGRTCSSQNSEAVVQARIVYIGLEGGRCRINSADMPDSICLFGICAFPRCIVPVYQACSIYTFVCLFSGKTTMMQAVVWALIGDAVCNGFTAVSGRPKVSQQMHVKSRSYGALDCRSKRGFCR